jgi:hypothetical protein
MTAKRYVVLEHRWEGIHFDLMLESGNKLRTWKLAGPPQHAQSQIASATFDHRLHYLTYEGPISENRGHVVRWDAGTYQEEAVEPKLLRVRLEGTRLSGVLELRWLEAENWECLYREI